jgi:PAS domain S-box-containing protein
MFTRLMTRGIAGHRAPERRTAIRLVWGIGALFLAMVAAVGAGFVYELDTEPVAHGLRACAHATAKGAEIAAIVGAIVLAISGWLVAFSIRLVRRALVSRDEARDLADHTIAFLSTMLEAAPDGVVIVDEAMQIKLVSAQVERAFGDARAELLGQPADRLFPPSVLRSAGETPRTEHAIAVECARRDGTTFPAEITTSPVAVGDAAHTIFVVRDVSVRRAMENQLQQSQRMEAIGQLTGGLAHDFNNLLGVIVGNLDLLERHVRTDERAATRVATAQRAALRGSDLTRRLLAFAKCQQLDPQPTSVNGLITELLEILPRTLGPELQITTALAPELPEATVDGPALESALLNLALNARDAMRGAGKLAFTTAAVQLGPDDGPVRAGTVAAGDYVRITVSDTGHGMAPATMARVFEPFFTTKSHGKGTGLGLAMVYGFVTQSRGHIHLHSEVGVGTTFTIDLPVAAAAATAPRAPAPAARRTSIDPATTVLVVDDEPDLREIAATYCQELGLRVLQASDGISALEIAVQQARLDLLLTDILMPGGLSGVALAACLRPQHPELRVIYCSGFPANALAERSELRVDAPLIHKPYLKHVFVQAITEALSKSVAPGDLSSPPRAGVEHELTTPRTSAPADRR